MLDFPCEAALALGSNIGDKENHLREAVRALDEHVGVWVVKTAPVYKTAPMYVTAQDWFLNSAVWVMTLLEPEALLDAVKGIEARIGRLPRERFGPREIDIDLLLYRRAERWAEVQTPRLELPHPRLGERPFALRPLLDVLSAAGLEAEAAPWAESLARFERRAAAPFLQENYAAEIASASAAALAEAQNSDLGMEQNLGLEPWPCAPLAPAAGHRALRHLDYETDTEALGESLGRTCRGGEVFALCGSLGAGKTCFVRGLARGLGVAAAQPVQSPTFTLCREYKTECASKSRTNNLEKNLGRDVQATGNLGRDAQATRGARIASKPPGPRTLYHWDFYRMESAQDAEGAGFYDSLDDPRGVTAVEWADRCPDLWAEISFATLWIFGVGEGPRRAMLRVPAALGHLLAEEPADSQGARSKRPATGAPKPATGANRP